MDWQDISTAPRDGTEIDVWCEDERGGYRIPDVWWNARRKGWCSLAYDNVLRISTPTHWMPSPPPPQPGEKQ